MLLAEAGMLLAYPRTAVHGSPNRRSRILFAALWKRALQISFSIGRLERWLQSRGDTRSHLLRGDDQCYRTDDESSGNQRAHGHRFTRKESSQQNGDDWIHICVSGYLRWIAMAQQPNIRSVPDDGSD